MYYCRVYAIISDVDLVNAYIVLSCKEKLMQHTAARCSDAKAFKL